MRIKRKMVCVCVLVFFASVSVLAQRFAYVDSDYILKHMPEYVSAQNQLDVISAKWQKEVDDRNEAIERMRKAYRADRILLTEEMRKKREADIADKENNVRDFQHLKFGVEGDLLKQRIKLIKPIQDRIAKAIQGMADAFNLDMVFDKNSEVTFLYANPRLDKSNDVIARLGYKPGSDSSKQ